ncbi:hypothetical protein OF83DRAFT_1144862 [Amylostereum chailletii]|nr:hypothetical protein OF83DRAFT_1144862 [Amylostereum chailletii]
MRFNLTVSISSPLVRHFWAKSEGVLESHQPSTGIVELTQEISFVFNGTGVWAYGGTARSEPVSPHASSYSILDYNTTTTLTDELNTYNPSRRKLVFGASGLDSTIHNLELAIQDPSLTVDYIDFETSIGGDDTYVETFERSRMESVAVVTNPTVRSVVGFRSMYAAGRYCFIGEAVALYGTSHPLVPFTFVLDGAFETVYAPRKYTPRLSSSELLYFSSNIDPGRHCLDFYEDRDFPGAPGDPAPVGTSLIIDRADVYRTRASDETVFPFSRRSITPSGHRSLAVLTAPPIILGLLFIMLVYVLWKRGTKRRAAKREKEDEAMPRPYPVFDPEEPRMGSSGWYSSPSASDSMRNILLSFRSRKSAKESVDLCAGGYYDQKQSYNYWDDSKSSSFGTASDKDTEAQDLAVPSSPSTLKPAFIQPPRTTRSMADEQCSTPYSRNKSHLDHSSSNPSLIPPPLFSGSSPISPTRIRPLPQLPRGRPLPQPQPLPVVPNRLGNIFLDQEAQWGRVKKPEDLQMAAMVEDSPPPYCIALQRIVS